MGRDYLLFGRRVLEEALHAGAQIKNVYFANEHSRKFAESLGLKAPLRKGLPDRIWKQNHQGIAFDVAYDFYVETLPCPLSRVSVLCNHLEDIGNFGAIIRSAAAFGVGLIIHEKRRSFQLNEAAIRISAGMAFRLKFMEVANIERVLRSVKDEGAWVVGLRENSQVSLYDWQPQFPLALVLGSEEKGMSKPVLKQLDEPLRIPMVEGVDSLNVSQAASIAMSWIQGRSRTG